MADRNFTDFQQSLEKGLVDLFAVVSVASGTPTLQKWTPPGAGSAGSYSAAPTTGVKYAKGWAGISTVARTGAGAWTVTLQDPYVRILSARATFSTASAATASPLVSHDSSSAVTTSTGGTIKLLFQATAAGGGVDPTDGLVILHFILQISSAR